MRLLNTLQDWVASLAANPVSRSPVLPEEPPLTDWQQAGLLKSSVVKPLIFTAEKLLIRKTLGRLSEPDQRVLRASLTRILG